MAAGVTDVLVANELIVPQQLERVAALARDAAVSVTVDSRSGADTLSAAAASPGVTLGGVVDVHVGLGRCGVPDSAAASELPRTVVAERHLRLDGADGVTRAGFRTRRAHGIVFPLRTPSWRKRRQWARMPGSA